MNSIVLRNGIWASIFLIGIGAIPLIFLGLPGPDDFKRGEVIGYTSILLSMIFIVIGMKQLKLNNGGVLSYWNAVKTGILITLFPAVAFGLYNLLYTYVIDPDFLTKYADYSLASRGAGKTGEELEMIKQAVLEEQKMFESPVIQFVLMFLTVFIIGAVVSLISAFFVKNKEVV
ncbi:MAG: DUF4199 domain-containing protein [Saprospiraceae bacterium]|nr:DUF4199 domain-containing protein [Saprospiraceae bacterium]